MSVKVEIPLCGTCGKEETFYFPKVVDFQDKQFASEEDLVKALDEEKQKRAEDVPFEREFMTGKDNIEYLVHFCSSECFSNSPDAADIPTERKKFVMDWNEKKNFKVQL